MKHMAQNSSFNSEQKQIFNAIFGPTLDDDTSSTAVDALH